MFEAQLVVFNTPMAGWGPRMVVTLAFKGALGILFVSESGELRRAISVVVFNVVSSCLLQLTKDLLGLAQCNLQGYMLFLGFETQEMLLGLGLQDL